MKISGRLSLLILLLLLFIFLGVLFRSYLLEYVVKPVALLFWVIWRCLSSVDQVFYWGMLIISALIYGMFSMIFRHLLKPAALERTPPLKSNATLESIRYWRTAILVTHDEIDKPNILKSNLAKMLASVNASKQTGTSNLEIHDALELHRLPLPKYVSGFLYPPESVSQQRTIKRFLQAFLRTPGNWVRRWTKSDLADYYRSIDEVISYMESSMEINHDEESIDAPEH